MKAYKFAIHASGSWRSAADGFITTSPMSTVHYEKFTGTMKEAEQRVKAVRAELIAARTYESGTGFSISARLCNGQRKPAGYDANWKNLCDNYLAD